ncbi:MAG: hypothetical protein OEP48_15345 [Betaproteobacteria bacterium]|nr:hypothetical protein [Betaproteobacteria bacterium]MDH3438593.1 hypothetical protein [Betaproteobacteria bacterium]
MTDLDLNNLRRFLDDEESFIASIPLNDPRAGLARQMLGLIIDARRSLAPSADSTANFVPVRDILAQLGQLRERLDKMPPKSRDS